MQVETRFKVEFEDCIGDYFDGDIDEKTKKELIEQHLKEWCKEHKIDRSSIKVIE